VPVREPDEAFRSLYELQWRPVFLAAYGLSRNQAISEDATQEAFVRALQRWGHLKHHPNPVGWLVTTALNCARRELRHRSREAVAWYDQAMVQESESVLDLLDEIRRLPRRQLQVVILRYAMDWSVEDIAEVLGCGPSTVRVHLSRAKRRLRTLLSRSLPASYPQKEAPFDSRG
jgi:RNA polymerase sigma-70 factor (ECF subfamily)